MKKRLILWFCSVAFLLTLLPACGNAGRGLGIYDGKGQLLIRADQVQTLYQDDRGAYLDIVLAEATAILAEQTGMTAAEAETQLFSGYKVYTAFDANAFTAMQKVLREAGYGEAACAMTDLKGGLIAAYSVDPEKNRAVSPTAPYSAFKPLSVYAPAMDAGVIDWFSTFTDAPYKQLENDHGRLEDWPSNSNHNYSYLDESLPYVVSHSLNTAAVRCLAQLGVDKSVDFLQNKLGADIAAEAYVLETMGGEEVIGNVALGYLEKGVSPVDMAGWYQIFATDGVYIQPKAVTKICDSKGNVIYVRSDDGKQVIRPVTAQQMNMLLREVVESDGTGREAACNGIHIAGKTGTGDQYSGNWFVGVTPGFSCAVWHGEAESNKAAALFGELTRMCYGSMGQIPVKFKEFSHIREIRTCEQTDLEAGKGCPIISVGYIPADHTLSKCEKHLK